jgi:serine/threonine protein kinase
MPLSPGTHLGLYELIGLLGSGGMGEVYRARDTRLNRDVAIKILPAAFSDDAECLDRFEREARILSTLNHPNLLSIYDVGSQNSIHYLVSELLDGEMLRQRIHGWGFADFKDGKPGDKALHETCFPCHIPAKDRDYVFTHYAP